MGPSPGKPVRAPVTAGTRGSSLPSFRKALGPQEAEEPPERDRGGEPAPHGKGPRRDAARPELPGGRTPQVPAPSRPARLGVPGSRGLAGEAGAAPGLAAPRRPPPPAHTTSDSGPELLSLSKHKTSQTTLTLGTTTSQPSVPLGSPSPSYVMGKFPSSCCTNARGRALPASERASGDGTLRHVLGPLGLGPGPPPRNTPWSACVWASASTAGHSALTPACSLPGVQLLHREAHTRVHCAGQRSSAAAKASGYSTSRHLPGGTGFPPSPGVWAQPRRHPRHRSRQTEVKRTELSLPVTSDEQERRWRGNSSFSWECRPVSPKGLAADDLFNVQLQKLQKVCKYDSFVFYENRKNEI